MKFEVLQEQLIQGLSLVTRAVANRPQLPVLANVLLEAKADGLVLSATDLELGMRTKVGAKVEEEGVASIPARTLLDFVGAMDPGKIKGSLVKESLVLTAGKYRGKIQTISAEEFPPLPKLTGEPMLVLAGEIWRRGVEAVVFAAAKDTLRPVLTGVLLSAEAPGLKLVATDGFRLSVKKVKAEGKGWEKPLLVPARALLEAIKLEGEGGLEITHYPKTNQVALVRGESMVVTQLLSGNYPEYKKIIPKEFEREIDLPREELLSALKAVYIFARENSNVVRWKVQEGGIELSAETPEKGGARAEVEGKLKGEEGEIVFNAKFVLDYLTAAAAENVTLATSSALSPGVFRETGKEEKKDWLYVVMPINA